MFKKIIFCLFIFCTRYSFASSEVDGHQASITSLIFPFINIGILVGFFFWKLKKPLSEFFQSKAKSIEDAVERAQVKSREAEVMLLKQEEKLRSLDSEIQKIHHLSDEELKKFEENIKLEHNQKIEKLKFDTVQKIEAQNQESYQNLNSIFINAILQKTQNALKTDKNLENQATKNLLGTLSK